MRKFTPNADVFPVRFDDLPGGAYQARMRQAFVDQANDALAKYSPRTGDTFQIGMEIEYSVVTDGDSVALADETIRNGAIDRFRHPDTHDPTFVNKELGASQIEINTDPVDVKKRQGLALLEEMKHREHQLSEQLRSQGARLLRMGCYPLLRIADIKRSSKEEKYELCPTFHNTNRRPLINYFIGDKTPIDVRDAAIPSLTNAVQANFDCATLEEAVENQNRALVHSAFVAALGANAGWIDQRDSGLADLRYIAWEISHDVRTWHESMNGSSTRVGIPAKYYDSIEDYLESVISHPFFMENQEAAFNMAIGTYWRDSRIKFLKKDDGIQLVVELRPLSTQPTVEGDFSLLMFYIGRIQYDRLHNVPLLPIHHVRANKELAMRMGRQATFMQYDRSGVIRPMTFNEMYDFELETAMQGLIEIGVDYPSVEFIRRLINALYREQAPVDRFRALVQNKVDGGTDVVSAMASAIKELNLIVR